MACLTSRRWQKWCYTYSGCGPQEALCAYAFCILDHCPGSALRPTMEENWVCLLADEGSQGREVRSVRQLPMCMARYVRKAERHAGSQLSHLATAWGEPGESTTEPPPSNSLMVRSYKALLFLNYHKLGYIFMQQWLTEAMNPNQFT